MSSNMRIQKICEYCKVEFTAKTTVTLYCSDNCAKRAYKARKRQEKIANVKSVERQKFENKLAEIKDKQFLSITEVCELLGASRMTIYRQIKSGNMKAAKLGRRIIIKRSAIDKLFN